MTDQDTATTDQKIYRVERYRQSAVTFPAHVIEDELAKVRSLIARVHLPEVGVDRLQREENLGRLDEEARAGSLLARAVEMVVDAVGEIALVGSEPRADMRLGLIASHARHDHDGWANQPPRNLQGGDAAW